MRKFWLENPLGKVWGLASNRKHDLGSSFMGKPDGLGIKTKVSFYEIENTFFIENVSTQAQTVSGTLYFTGYEHYKRFVAFIGNVNTQNPLKLYYTSDGTSYDNRSDKQWYKLVLISELKKSEISPKTSALEVSIKFDCLSRWRKDKDVALEITQVTEPDAYPRVYKYIKDGVNYLAVDIDNTDNLPTSCRVRIDGVCKNPLFRIMQNEQILDQAKYYVDIDQYSFLLVDSSVDHQEASLCRQLSGDAIFKDNVYASGERNYAYSNFITIPSGLSTFMVSVENGNAWKVALSYSIQKELI